MNKLATAKIKAFFFICFVSLPEYLNCGNSPTSTQKMQDEIKRKPFGKLLITDYRNLRRELCRELCRFREGVLIAVNIRYWQAQKKLNAQDIGIDPDVARLNYETREIREKSSG